MRPVGDRRRGAPTPVTNPGGDMAESKVIAVVGSTGAQGCGLVRAISADPDSGFVARAITRDPDSDAAKALAELPNVAVVRADLEDPTSVEAAFAGAHG